MECPNAGSSADAELGAGAVCAISLQDFERVVRALGDQATEDIAWAEGCTLPRTAEEFATETIFVIANSGMKNTVARQIFERCMVALHAGQPVIDVFKHKGKAAAMEHVWRERVALLRGFLAAPDRLAYCETLPWIGAITKYHLAKNFGQSLAKPDVHLQRLADREGTTPQALCERLAALTGYRVATIDTLLWRACATGVLDSRTGELRCARGS